MRVVFGVLSFVLCIVALLPSAVAQDQPSRDEVSERLAQSVERWGELKAQYNDTGYAYTVSNSSWVGFGNQTRIVVRDGVVIERHYHAWDDKGQTTTTWTESGEQIGTHDDGAPPKTYDALLDYADETLSMLPEDNPHLRLYYQANEDGLMESCFYVDTRIADDAPSVGVRIGELQLIEPSE